MLRKSELRSEVRGRRANDDAAGGSQRGGAARLLLGALQALGWAQLLDVRLATLTEVGLTISSPDREVWLRAQELGMLLLTDNRNTSGPDSLEWTLTDALTPTSLPVLTFGHTRHFLSDRAYRSRCAERVAEIIFDLEQYRGITRLYIP